MDKHLSSGFMYFLPGEESFSQVIIDKYGLTGILDTNPEKGMAVINGVKGPILRNQALQDKARHGKALTYRQDEQTWVQAEAGYSLGWYTKHPPLPEHLQRSIMLPGTKVTLADGNRWVVPLARAYNESGMASTLPQAITGFDSFSTMTEYARLEELADQILDQYMNASIPAMLRQENRLQEAKDFVAKYSYQDLVKLAIEVMGFNYKVKAEEVFALKLLTTSNLSELLYAVVDLDAFLEMLTCLGDNEKKLEEGDTPSSTPDSPARSQDGTSSTEDGSSDLPEATPLPEQTG